MLADTLSATKRLACRPLKSVPRGYHGLIRRGMGRGANPLQAIRSRTRPGSTRRRGRRLGAEGRAMTPEQAVAYALEDNKALLALPPSIRSRTR